MAHDDLYAAFQLQQSADEFRFGRAATQASRRQTRFLFYSVVMQLLRGQLLYLTSKPQTPKQLTDALLRLYAAEDSGAVRALLDTAIEVVDEYMNETMADCIYKEPSYAEFNNDLNRYLKWEKLAKNSDASPHLYNLLASFGRDMGRSRAGQPSARDQIRNILGL